MNQFFCPIHQKSATQFFLPICRLAHCDVPPWTNTHYLTQATPEKNLINHGSFCFARRAGSDVILTPKIMQETSPKFHFYIQLFSFTLKSKILVAAYTANIYSGKWDTHKKCKSYKYLPQILQCRSVDITVNHCKSVFTFFHCNWSSDTM